MRRIWRILRVVWTLIRHTTVTSWRVRRLPEEAREAYRARRQMEGTRILCRHLGVQVTLHGQPPERTMLLVCNHLGVLDPLVLSSQMPLAFAGKADLGRWPLIGWVCRTYGMLLVYRERLSKTSRFVQEVREKLRVGVSMLIFPEGTTSHGATVMPFKTGGFEAVADLDGGAVLPLHLHIAAVEGDPARREEATWAGNTQTFIEHVWHLAGLTTIEVHVSIGAAIATGGRDRKVLAQRAHAAVLSLHDRAGVSPSMALESAV